MVVEGFKDLSCYSGFVLSRNPFFVGSSYKVEG